MTSKIPTRYVNYCFHANIVIYKENTKNIYIGMMLMKVAGGSM